jgi:hypothetical protein
MRKLFFINKGGVVGGREEEKKKGIIMKILLQQNEEKGNEKNLPREVKSDDFIFHALNMIIACRIRWVPVCDAQENTLRGTCKFQGVRAEQPVTRSMLDARGLYVSRPISNVKMEACIQ